MKVFVQPGDVLTLTAPAGGVVSGTAYLIGGLVVVAEATAAATEKFPARTAGVYTLAKATGQTWAEGAKLYWDDTAKKFTTTSTSNTFAGHAVAAAATGDTTGQVRLHGAST